MLKQHFNTNCHFIVCKSQHIVFYYDYRVTVSIRDLLSWVHFINSTAKTLDQLNDSHLLEPAVAYIHGACMVFLDALGAGM